MAAKSRSGNSAKTFNKGDLVETLVKNHPDLTKTKANAIVSDVFESMKGAMKKNHRVSISGFGSYTTTTLRKEKGGKKMYMPALGKEIVTKPKPTRLKVTFRPAQDLRIK